jgi:hypothetical protein
MAMAAAQALLSAQGLDALRVEQLLFFAAVYTLPALAMVAVTAAPRRRMAAAGDKDTSAVQVVRLTNRAIASTAMFTLPAVVVGRNLATWTPWGGGTWCAPLDPLQTVLLHMQLMYYVMDTPYTLLKRDMEQIVHHTIGFGLALPTVRMGKCGLPMCAVMFTEQARGGRRGGARCAPAQRRGSAAAGRQCAQRRLWAGTLCGACVAAPALTRRRARSRRAARVRRAAASGCATPSWRATSCRRIARWSGCWSRSTTTRTSTSCASSSTRRCCCASRTRCARPPTRTPAHALACSAHPPFCMRGVIA